MSEHCFHDGWRLRCIHCKAFVSERNIEAHLAVCLVATAEARFWTFCERTGGCWEWQGTLNTRGYGWFLCMGAHRFSWELQHGPIPAGMTVHHLCFNKACVNPAHMQLLTRSDHGRVQNPLPTHCRRGHERTPENTYFYSERRRLCKTCSREAAIRREVRLGLIRRRRDPAEAAFAAALAVSSTDTDGTSEVLGSDASVARGADAETPQ